MILIEFKNVNDVLTKSTFFEKIFQVSIFWVFKFLRHVNSRQVLEYTLGSEQICTDLQGVLKVGCLTNGCYFKWCFSQPNLHIAKKAI